MKRTWRQRLRPVAAETLQGLPQSWGVSLSVAIGLLVGVGLLARTLTTVGLLTSGLVGPVVVAVLLGLLCLAQLAGAVLTSVRAGSGRLGAGWRTVNLISVLMSLGLYVETFAAVSVCLWRADGRPVGPWGGLWHAESFFLWHVGDSIPLLTIAETVHWSQPAYAAAHTPPGLVLAFKLIVIIPLARAAVSGYQLAVQAAIGHGSRERPDLDLSPAQLRWAAAGAVAGMAALSAGVTWLVAQTLDPGTVFQRWWTGTALPALHADAPLIVRWATAAPALVLLAGLGYALLVVLYGSVSAMSFEGGFLPHARSFSVTALMLAGAVVWLYGVVLWDAGFLLALDHLGSGVHLSSWAQTRTVIESLLWYVVDMLPYPDITGTLRWAAPVAIGGGLAGWVLLVLKALVAGAIVVLAVPIGQTFAVRARYGPVIDVWAAALAASGHLAKDAGWWDEPFASFGRYPEKRRALDQAAQMLAAQQRFADLRPYVQGLLDALPEGPRYPLPAGLRTDLSAALLAYRAQVGEHFSGAAGAVAEMPGWLPDASPGTVAA